MLTPPPEKKIKKLFTLHQIEFFLSQRLNEKYTLKFNIYKKISIVYRKKIFGSYKTSSYI